MKETLILLSVAFGVTLILFAILTNYYRSETQKLFELTQILNKGWKHCSESWNETINEVILRGNKILELVNSINILKNQNKRYSKICRRLYDENQNLKLEVKAKESLFQDMKNKENEFELKVTELENKKKRKKE